MKRLIALILVALMALSIASCGGNQPAATTAPSVTNTPKTDDSAASGTVTTEPVAELEIPDTKYDNAEFVVISAGQVAYGDFSFDDTVTEVLDAAQY